MSDTLTDLRLQLFRNGYVPLPNVDKRCTLKGWPRLKITEKAIKAWGFKIAYPATGLRIGDGDKETVLAAIDLDAAAMALIVQMAKRADEVFGLQFLETTIARGRDGSSREMWFMRMAHAEATRNLSSRVWYHPDDPEMKSNQVELFCAPHSRQVGAFGPHSHDALGNVLAKYFWKDDFSPKNVPFKELPIVTRAQAVAFIEACDKVFEEAGYVLKPSMHDSASGTTQYDLTEDMDYDGMTLSDLRHAAAMSEDGYRLSARFIDPAAVSLKCIAHCRGDEFWIYNFDGETTHRPVEDDPERVFEGWEDEDEAIAESVREAFDKATKPDPDAPQASDPDEYMAKLAELVETKALLLHGRGGVVTLGAFRAEPSSVRHMKDVYARFNRPVGKSGLVNVVQDWLAHPDRKTIDGVQFRPDRQWPVFQDGNMTYANFWRPIGHGSSEGGETKTFHDFMRHLIPDDFERQWFMECLAHKAQHPEVPGPAVIMVAEDTFGVGRTTLTEIIEELFNGHGVTMDFEDLTGTGAQSHWNAQVADTLWVFTNEAVTEDSATFRMRKKIMDKMKTIVDPSGTTKRTFRQKHQPNWVQTCAASYVILSNHMDAVPLIDDDRRFKVTPNGTVPMTQAMALDVRAWMRFKPNIALLWEELMAMKMTVFNPYVAPPMNKAKQDMIDMNRSEVSEAVRDAFKQMQPVFFREQVEGLALSILGTKPMPDASVIKAIKIEVKRQARHMVGERDGVNHRHPSAWGLRSIYARTEAIAAKYKNADTALLRKLVAKNDSVDTHMGEFDTQKEEE